MRDLRRSSARPRHIKQIGTVPPDTAAPAAAYPGDRGGLTIKDDSPRLSVQVRLGELPGC